MKTKIRILKKHFVRFAKSVRFFSEDDEHCCEYYKAKAVNGKNARKCWQYALETGHRSGIENGGTPIFRPDRKYWFSVELTDDDARLVHPVRTPSGRSLAHARPDRNERKDEND